MPRMAPAYPSQSVNGSTNGTILFYRLAKVCAARWLKSTVTPKQRAKRELVEYDHSHQNGRRGRTARANCSLSHPFEPAHAHRVVLTCVASSAAVSHSRSSLLRPLHSPVGPRRVQLMRESPLPRALRLCARMAPVMARFFYASLPAVRCYWNAPQSQNHCPRADAPARGEKPLAVAVSSDCAPRHCQFAATQTCLAVQPVCRLKPGSHRPWGIHIIPICRWRHSYEIQTHAQNR